MSDEKVPLSDIYSVYTMMEQRIQKFVEGAKGSQKAIYIADHMRDILQDFIGEIEWRTYGHSTTTFAEAKIATDKPSELNCHVKKEECTC